MGFYPSSITTEILDQAFFFKLFIYSKKLELVDKNCIWHNVNFPSSILTSKYLRPGINSTLVTIPNIFNVL